MASTPKIPEAIGRARTLADTWAALLIEELGRLGLSQIVLAPGSRSTPLLLAAARRPGWSPLVHFDERGLGFFALGLARASGGPVAVLTTSGTAVANLLPALVEARWTGVPLLVLSADRPPDQIDVGANQAIPQPGLLVGAGVQTLHLPEPTSRIEPGFVLGLAGQAWQHLQAGRPVHMNCPFAEPLYRSEPSSEVAEVVEGLGEWLRDERPWLDTRPPEMRCESQADWPAFSSRRGVLVAGRLGGPTESEAVSALAAALGWPLLTDLQSQLRSHPASWPYPTLALHADAARTVLERAEVVLQFGGRLVGKALNRWLAETAWADRWLVDPSERRLDPAHGRHRRIRSTARAFVDAHAASASDWADRPPDAVEPTLLREVLSEWSELSVCHAVWERASGALVVGNSLPIRLLDHVAGPRSEEAPFVFANRGASGIDGLIATAAGVALGHEGPTTVLLGDLSALHDLNSLALTRRGGAPFVVVLINNDGGSIFRMLPVPREDGLLERYYQAPHGLDFEGAAAMFGLAYRAPTDRDSFCRDYEEALRGGVTLIEACFAPQEGVDALARLTAAVAGSADRRPADR